MSQRRPPGSSAREVAPAPVPATPPAPLVATVDPAITNVAKEVVAAASPAIPPLQRPPLPPRVAPPLVTPSPPRQPLQKVVATSLGFPPRDIFPATSSPVAQPPAPAALPATRLGAPPLPVAPPLPARPPAAPSPAAPVEPPDGLRVEDSEEEADDEYEEEGPKKVRGHVRRWLLVACGIVAASIGGVKGYQYYKDHYSNDSSAPPAPADAEEDNTSAAPSASASTALPKNEFTTKCTFNINASGNLHYLCHGLDNPSGKFINLNNEDQVSLVLSGKHNDITAQCSPVKLSLSVLKETPIETPIETTVRCKNK